MKPQLSQEQIQQIIQEAQNELCRREFWHFCLFYNPDFFSERFFLKQIADGLQKIYTGEIKRLAISMPPRSGKSYTTSLYCAWMLGNNPTGSVMRNCATMRLYNIFSYHIRKIIRTDKFKQIFPSVELAEDKQNLEGWNLKNANVVSYFGAGVGGQIVGIGATIVAITDDLVRSYEDSISEVLIEKTLQWYDIDHLSRLETGCPQIDIGTRWSKNDPIGRNIENNFYDEIISISALDESGKSFSENVKTTAEFQELKNKLAPEVWESMYQQNPIERSGLLFKKSEMKYYNSEQFTAKLKSKEITPEAILMYIDVADEGKDMYAAAVGYVLKNSCYLTDVIYSGETVDYTIPVTLAMIDKHKPNYTFIETNNQGGMVIRSLKEKGAVTSIIPVRNTTNKHSRIINSYGFIKSYFYFPEKQEGELIKFMENIFSYIKAGKTTKDDAPDCLSGLASACELRYRHLFV